jgi:DNA-binding NtrC family response regulator
VRSPFLGFGSEQALRDVADALPDGLFTTDAEGNITFWNAAAARITGWTSAEAVGKSCSLLAGDVVNGCSCGAGPIRCGLASDRRRSSRQCATRTRDGRPLLIVKSAVTIYDESGAPVGALESFMPVREEPERPAAEPADLGGLVGRHPLMLELFRLIRLVATSSAPVMITGESGTGKELVAAAIHALGPRASRTFARVPCAGVDPLLAPDGSPVDRAPGEPPNPFTRASGGTLLLDELGGLAPAAQLKLLHFLEARETRRSEDVRILCTTNSDLKRAVGEGRFRADLWFRLNVFPLRVPALREHFEDVPAIAQHVLRRREPPLELAPETGFELIAHRWPGNVRELQNALDYAALHCAGSVVLPEHLPPELRSGRPSPPPVEERARIAEALATCGGNRTLAARALGISRVTLWKRMKKHAVGERDG